MTRSYKQDLQTLEEKHQYLANLAKIAKFYHAAWYMEDVVSPNHIKGFEKHEQGEFVSLLVQYLKDANSKLSAPILARFYSQALEDDSLSDEFVEATKACVAFFTLWRSAKSTSGLDDIYRKFFRGSTKVVKVKKHNWKNHPKPISSDDLKQYFLETLKQNKISEKDNWISESQRFLLYTELKKISRFVLFIAGHDRVADDKRPGLTEEGIKDVCPLLTLTRWKSKDHKTLEHIAPKKLPEEHTWDEQIYLKNKEHDIGNIMLLPIDVNRYADNKDWDVKYLYYSHVGVRKKKKIEQLKKEAKKRGVTMSKKAIKKLTEAKYNCAVEPLLKVGIDGNWNAKMIDQRTKQIKEIAWTTLSSWLKT